ncbi:uncharacterized protein LOC120348355 isoform X2 [Styela clava]
MDTKRTQLDENNNETPPLKRRRNNLCNIVSLPGPGETQLRHKRAKRVQSQWAYLPAEVLVKIFGYLVNQDTGALPCLLRLSKVCRHWRMTANIPFLWSNLHFAPYVLKSQRGFKNNVKSFRLMAGAHFCSVENLVCDELPMVAPIIIKTISNYARRIRVLSIQRCGSISMKNCLQAIVDRHLSSLQEFCICHTSIPTFDIRKILSGFYGSSFSTLLLHVSGSLKEFHLDNYGDLNAELYSCVDIMYWQSISILSVRYTNISARVLELLLHYCLTNIQVLNLDVCHCLPKCLRKRWEKDQLAQIKESLRQLHQQGRRHT